MSRRPLRILAAAVPFLLAGCVHAPSLVSQRRVLVPADYVIRGVAVVDVVHRSVVPDQDVQVRAGRIVEIGPADEVSAGIEVVDGRGRIALPGFVNTHTHLWQHVAKGFYPSGNLQEWVRIYRYAHYLTRDELYDAIDAAASQALLSGITTVADFASSNFSEFAFEATCLALRDAGLGGAVVLWHPAVFLPPEIRRGEVERLRSACDPLEVWMGPGPLSFFPLPAVYDGVLLAGELGLPVSEHTMENVQEQRDLHSSLKRYLDEQGQRLAPQDLELLEQSIGRGAPSQVDNMTEVGRRARRLLFEEGHGEGLTEQERKALENLLFPESVSPVPILERLGALGDFLAIHSVWSEPSDLEIYRRNGVAVSINPDSNEYLSSGIASVLEMMEREIVVSIGTDGAASNDGIDFFSAMRGLWNQQKLSYLDSAMTRRLDAWDVLAAATLGGADALGMAGETGSLEAGKEADVLLLDMERLGLAPLVRAADVDNVAALIVYSAGVRDVDTVFSDGRVVVRGGRLVRRDEAQLARRLTEVSTRVVERQQTGKRWIERYELDGAQLDRYFARYRSVRLKDEVLLELVNTGRIALEATLMMSGTTFGGTVPATLKPESRGRFPSAPPADFFERAVTLAPGQRLTFRKASGDSLYRLAAPAESLTIPGARSQQLAVVVRRADDRS